MSNPSATTRAALWVGCVALSSSISRAALAEPDTKQECSEAFDNTQVLRDAGNIEAALKEAAVCTRDVCAKFIRDDCATWKVDLERRQSSVVVEVKDPKGAPVTEGTVLLDGAPFMDRLDGLARTLPKGPHTLEITVTGAAPYKKSLEIREAEKDRKVSLSLQAGDDEGGLDFVLVDADSPPPPPRPPSLVIPSVVTGIGGFAVGVAGGVLLGLAASNAGEITELCGSSPPACAGSDADRTRANELATSGKQLEIAGGTLAAVGAASLSVGLTMLIVQVNRESSGKTPGAGALPTGILPAPWFGRGEGGVWLHGAF